MIYQMELGLTDVWSAAIILDVFDGQALRDRRDAAVIVPQEFRLLLLCLLLRVPPAPSGLALWSLCSLAASLWT